MILESTIKRSTCNNTRMRNGGTLSKLLQCHHEMLARLATSLKFLKAKP